MTMPCALPLLERGLLLGEMGSCPVLIAPKDPVLQGDGLAREGVELYGRAGSPIHRSVNCSPCNS